MENKKETIPSPFKISNENKTLMNEIFNKNM